VLVEALEDIIAYPNGVDKVELSKGSSILLEPKDAEFLLKRNLVKEAKPKKETKPKAKAKKETKPSKKKKETK
jgi:hypothetical protein